jgi:hypothetical protein
MPINVTATLRQAMQSLQSERRQIDGRIRAVQTALGISTNSHSGSNSRRPASHRPQNEPGGSARAVEADEGVLGGEAEDRGNRQAEEVVTVPHRGAVQRL